MGRRIVIVKQKNVSAGKFLLPHCTEQTIQSSKSEVTLTPKILNKSLINPHIKRIQIEDIEVKYSITIHKNLQNIRRYNQYTNKLVEEMIRLRSEGLMYKDIASYLSDRGYKSSYGKVLSAKLVERMIVKRRISIERSKVKKIEFSDIVIELLSAGER